MAESNAATKEDLQNMVLQLTTLIKDTANDLKIDITAEMDRRFDGVNKNFAGVNERFDGVNKNFEDMNNRFRRAERKQQAFQKEVENQFHQLRGMVENRFDLSQKYTDEKVVKEIRKVITMLDGQAGMAENLKIEQQTLGVLQSDLEASNKSNGAAIKDLDRRVTVLEEKVLDT